MFHCSTRRVQSVWEYFEKKLINFWNRSLFRPTFNYDIIINEDLKSLITKNWDEDPEKRDSFKEINNKLKIIHKKLFENEVGNEVKKKTVLSEIDKKTALMIINHLKTLKNEKLGDSISIIENEFLQ